MKDPVLPSSAWTDSLSLRLRVSDVPNASNNAQLDNDAPRTRATEPARPKSVATKSQVTPTTGPPSSSSSSISFNPSVRHVAKQFKQIRKLASAEMIILFTPVIIPAHMDRAAILKDKTDPFEPLGRALSEHHARIRHVPFVPHVGFTSTHYAFLTQASAVVTVVCEPDSGKAQSVEEQVGFVESAREAVEDVQERYGGTVPFLLIECCSDALRPLLEMEEPVAAVACEAYTADVAETIADAVWDKQGVA
jgi:hypothetical protein